MIFSPFLKKIILGEISLLFSHVTHFERFGKQRSEENLMYLEKGNYLSLSMNKKVFCVINEIFVCTLWVLAFLCHVSAFPALSVLSYL